MDHGIDIIEALPRLLTDLDPAGAFAAAGSRVCPMPSIDVERVGPIAFPLLPVQAKAIIAAATPAPYGRGDETLVDPAVRKTWQIDASRIRIDDDVWRETLAEIVRDVARGLGVAGPIEAELYKLLAYDEGAFFSDHRDTEKVDGMFATLVVALPSRHEGGAIAVRHAGRELTLDLRNSAPSRLTYAAFYADCEHEVKPITSGFRVCLIYNLVRRGRGRVAPPDHRPHVERAERALRGWAAGDDSPDKLLYVLEHRYSPAGLAFANLKGNDASLGAVLVSASRAAECTVHLAMLSKHESGGAEYNGRRPTRGGWYGYSDHSALDDDFEAGEVVDARSEIADWRDVDDAPVEIAPLPFEEWEVCPDGALDGLEPDEQSFHEATGNEGASFERTYRRAAIVLWPTRRALTIAATSGVDPALALLAKSEGPTALELARRMAAEWPHYRFSWEPARERARFYRELARIGASEVTADMFRSSCVLDRFGNREGTDEIDAIIACWRSLDRAVLGPALAALVERAVRNEFGPIVDTVARAAEHDARAARAALAALMAHTPADDSPAARALPAQAVAQLVTSFARWGDVGQARALATHILENRTRFPLDGVLVPAVVELTRVSPSAPRDVLVSALGDVVLLHLELRVGQRLEPPADLARDLRKGCSCEDCGDLAKFMHNPRQARWVLKANEHRRRHIEGRAAREDVDAHTVRSGSPHSLVLEKNQRSYEARVAQRKEDLGFLAQLEPALGSAAGSPANA